MEPDEEAIVEVVDAIVDTIEGEAETLDVSPVVLLTRVANEIATRVADSESS